VSTYVELVTVVVVVVVVLGYPRPTVMYDFWTSVKDVVTLALTTPEYNTVVQCCGSKYAITRWVLPRSGGAI